MTEIRLLKMNLILLLIVWLLITYNISGIYLAIPLILAILNVGISTILLIFSPDSFTYKVIKIISVLYIGIILLIQIKPLFDFLIQ
jgi:hypothetical protein